MISRVYIAAPSQLQEEAKVIRQHLRAADVEVTSRWIDLMGTNQLTDEQAAECDLADVRDAQAVVLLNPRQWRSEGTGGRHVEVGAAIILGMPVFVLGAASNIFHTLQLVRVVESIDDLIARLAAADEPEPTIPHSHGYAINQIVKRVHRANAKWWVDLATGEPLKRNVGELLMLVCSEMAEAMEGHRKNLPDDKLSHRRMFEVELADGIIRIFDIAGGFSLDLGGAFEEKMDYNAVRVDHSHAHRLSEHGKKY